MNYESLNYETMNYETMNYETINYESMNYDLWTMKHNDDATLQVLNMTGNDLREVGAQAFSSAGLLNLQRVFSHFSRFAIDLYLASQL